jgi:hypothetical protein
LGVRVPARTRFISAHMAAAPSTVTFRGEWFSVERPRRRPPLRCQAVAPAVPPAAVRGTIEGCLALSARWHYLRGRGTRLRCRRRMDVGGARQILMTRCHRLTSGHRHHRSLHSPPQRVQGESLVPPHTRGSVSLPLSVGPSRPPPRVWQILLPTSHVTLLNSVSA